MSVTDFSGAMGDVIAHVLDGLSSVPLVSAREDLDRTHASGYYPSVCMKVRAVVGNQEFEFADGGIVDWSQAMLSNRKERMMISGASVDRLAALRDEDRF